MIIFIILFIIAIIYFLIKKRNAKKEVARREKTEVLKANKQEKSRQNAINDNKEQYSFDSWDKDMLEEIIEDEPCWYDRSNIKDTDIGKNVEYTATRLTFRRDEIEQLNDGDYIKIHVSQDNATYKMTKREFYQTFNNVVSSKSYREIGNYNYGKTPSKALKYLI